jgi:hypothetical protein
VAAGQSDVARPRSPPQRGRGRWAGALEVETAAHGSPGQLEDVHILPHDEACVCSYGTSVKDVQYVADVLCQL